MRPPEFKMEGSVRPELRWAHSFSPCLCGTCGSISLTVFFLAFLPQFVVEGAGPASAQLFLHGSLIIVVAAFVEPLMVMLGSKLTQYLGQNTRVAKWMDRGLGALFVGLGVRLALSDRA